MRRRLIVSTLAVTLISVILLGVPLGVVASRLIRDEAQKRLVREAANVAADIDALRAAGRPLDTAALSNMAPADSRVTVVFGHGSSPISAGSPITRPVLSAVARGSYSEVVTVSASDKETTHQIATVWLVVGGLGIIALGVAVGLAALQARRFGRPLEDLVVAAERLGSGDPSPQGRRYRVPEIDKVAQVLDRSAERIGGLLRAEHEFAANASHQLRTPLTAVSIRLEEIIAMAWRPTVKAEATAALAAVERLTDVIDSLLTDRATSARPHHTELVDIDGVVEQQREEWEPAFRIYGRALITSGDRGLKASGNHGIVAQALATLIDNTLVHGRGTVRIAPRNAGGHVVIDVTDEGAGVADELVPLIFQRSFSSSSSTGLGLSLARDLIEADGGRLELTSARPPVFSIFLMPDRLS